jgi:hypothetical protein
MNVDEQCHRGCGAEIRDTNSRPEKCNCSIAERAAQFAVWVINNPDYINTCRILRELEDDDRKVYRADEIPPETLEAIENAEMDPKHDHLNDEL